MPAILATLCYLPSSSELHLGKPRRQRGRPPREAQLDPRLDHFNEVLSRLDGIAEGVQSLGTRVSALDGVPIPNPRNPTYSSSPVNARQPERPGFPTRRPRRRHLRDDADDSLRSDDSHRQPLKSGYTKSSSDYVVTVADWPHLYVNRSGCPPPPYDTLAMHEFVMGYLDIIMSYELPEGAERHAYHLRSLLSEAGGNDWSVIRAAHKSVLHAVEHGHIDWNDDVAVKLEYITAMRQVPRGKNGTVPNHPPNYGNASDIINHDQSPCPDFQVHGCQHRTDHRSNSRNGYIHVHTAGRWLAESRSTPRLTVAESSIRVSASPKKRRDGGQASITAVVMAPGTDHGLCEVRGLHTQCAICSVSHDICKCPYPGKKISSVGNVRSVKLIDASHVCNVGFDDQDHLCNVTTAGGGGACSLQTRFRN